MKFDKNKVIDVETKTVEDQETPETEQTIPEVTPAEEYILMIKKPKFMRNKQKAEKPKSKKKIGKKILTGVLIGGAAIGVAAKVAMGLAKSKDVTEQENSDGYLPSTGYDDPEYEELVDMEESSNDIPTEEKTEE